MLAKIRLPEKRRSNALKKTSYEQQVQKEVFWLV